MNYIRSLLFVVIAQFLLAPLCAAQDNTNTLINGTLIITLTSQDTIWIGADSRTSSLTDKGYTVNKNGMCKIYSTNGIIYAMAGHVRYVDNSFNFLEIMQAAINDEQDFSRSMEVFQQRAKVEIKSILRKFSRKSINTLIKTNKGSFLSVVAISFNNNEKKMTEMKFSIEANTRNNWNVIYKKTEDNGVGSLKFVGHATHVAKFVRDNNLYFGNGRNMPAKISELIRLESKATITVGMPVDVISIYNGGYKRVINSGYCSE